VLARLDKLEGVAESRVDWTGRIILILLREGAEPDSVAHHAAEHLGSGAARQAPPSEAETIESFRRGEPWMRAGETLELSQHESKVLGKSLAARAGGSIRDEAHRRRLESILEEEFLAVFTRIHAGELTLGEALKRGESEIGPRIQKRLLEFLTPEQTQSVMDSLRRAVFGGD
jgi:hypothetical protein